ncbi:MAG: hypothetical protein MJ114_08105 [Acetatifactor sp.]|nr:hypothetical protein [Acetatifactor sp.]
MKRTYEQTISNLPPGILSCFWGDLDPSVTECSPAHVTLRLSADSVIPEDTLQFHAFFWGRGYESFGPFSACLVSEEIGPFQREVTFEVHDEDFAKMVNALQLQLYRYIKGKLDSEGNEFSEALTGYPAFLDADFAKDYADWLSGYSSYFDQLGQCLKSSDLPLYLSLETLGSCQKYLTDTLTAPFTPSGIYIGNAWCHNQFPDKDLLLQILEAAHLRRQRIVLVLSYLRDCLMEHYTEVLDTAFGWCQITGQTMELELNDLGWLAYFEEHKEYLNSFTLNFGRLLNKRRRDPRLPYKDGLSEEMTVFAENSLNDPDLLTLLRDHNISRIEQECCGYFMKMPCFPQTLHLPFYQTNTSQNCPLQAVKTTGNRGAQQFLPTCDRACESHVLLYPKHLGLIGKYNSLFAVDRTITLDTINTYREKGVDRILWNLSE